jgi:hypothetical protein
MGEIARVSRDKILIGIRYLTPLTELGASGHDLGLRVMRFVGLPQYRASHLGLTNHAKASVEIQFSGLRLQVRVSRYVERR